MTLAQLKELLELVPEMRELGVRRLRFGECEIELGVGDFVHVNDLLDASLPEEQKAPDDGKCVTPGCGRPQGRLVRGLCRECSLGAAGVSLA